ncbi:hypothetical protein Taro_000909 [Colocasia esculenta]|uniref:Uncharacterized protein n=1 Tax=Colocasia esculenta TaxID=4460 RepID=A0A843T9F3_COLES|nr:hypothetical protein [Colocasia esculenta]
MQQEDGETLTGQTERSCPTKTELQRRVEEFYSSYCSLAGFWGENCGSTKVEPPSPSPEPGIGSRLQHLLPDEDSPEDDQLLSVRHVGERSDPQGPALDVAAGSLDQHISRSEQMSKIAEDVVGELARRYDEKREANRVLRCQAERMMEESRALRLDCERLVSENGALHSELTSITGVGKNLQGCPRCSSLVKKQRRPLFSRFKSLFF